MVGGGVASLAAAAYLIRDRHMHGKNITILEESNIMGGSMDGSGNTKDGYVVRGGREMKEHYECSWDLFSDEYMGYCMIGMRFNLSYPY